MLSETAVRFAFQIIGIVVACAFLGLAAFGVIYSLVATIRRAGVLPLSLRYASARLINVVAALGVAIGVAAVIVVMSVMNGFISEQRKLIRGSLADITIQPAPEQDSADGRPRMPAKFKEYERILKDTPHVAAVAPRFVWAALLFPPEVLNKFALARRGSDFIVEVRGIDPAAEKNVSNFQKWIGPISPDETGVTPEERAYYDTVADASDPFAKIIRPGALEKEAAIVGVTMARNLRLRRGTRIELATLSPHSTREKPSQPNMFFDVGGMFHTQEQEFDLHTVLVTIPALQTFLSERDSDFTEIAVKLDDYNNADAARLEIGASLRKAGLISARGLGFVKDPPPAIEQDAYRYEIRTWEEQKGGLLRAVDNERGILGFIVFVVVVVAAFIEFAILSMMVTEKTRDVGILSTLGASAGEILAIFVDVGVAMSAAGAALGLALALLVSNNLNNIDEFIEIVTGNRIFDPNVYYLKTIPSEIDWIQVAWILTLTLASGVLASLIPAWRASRMDPAHALRYE